MPTVRDGVTFLSCQSEHVLKEVFVVFIFPSRYYQQTNTQTSGSQDGSDHVSIYLFPAWTPTPPTYTKESDH